LKGMPPVGWATVTGRSSITGSVWRDCFMAPYIACQGGRLKTLEGSVVPHS
jgi:hypothetical protein